MCLLTEKKRHMICTPDNDCVTEYFGFGGQHMIEVTWLTDSQRPIIYDNPFLSEDSSEGEQAIG